MRNQKGQAVAEYGLVMALIILVCGAVVYLLGGGTPNTAKAVVKTPTETIVVYPVEMALGLGGGLIQFSKNPEQPMAVFAHSLRVLDTPSRMFEATLDQLREHWKTRELILNYKDVLADPHGRGHYQPIEIRPGPSEKK